MNCRVCGTKLEQDYSTCHYCGFDNPVLFTQSADRSGAYWVDLLAKIENISVFGIQYQYDADVKSFREIGTKPFYYSSTGKTCYENYYFSANWLAHFEGDTEITIFYTLDKVQKSVKARIYAEDYKGIWHLVLHINKELRLEVFLYIEREKGANGSLGAGEWLKMDTVDLDFSV